MSSYDQRRERREHCQAMAVAALGRMPAPTTRDPKGLWNEIKGLTDSFEADLSLSELGMRTKSGVPV